ncbi:MAG: nucleotide pyrophosphohydrolase [Spirochaetota bacterium]
MDTQLVQQLIQKFVTDRQWERYHTPKNVAIALSVEVSELLEIFQWKTDQEVSDIDKNSDTFVKIKEEFADSMIYLLRFADLLDIDAEEVVLEKLTKNSEKYPVETSKGEFVKYNERT